MEKKIPKKNWEEEEKLITFVEDCIIGDVYSIFVEFFFDFSLHLLDFFSEIRVCEEEGFWSSAVKKEGNCKWRETSAGNRVNKGCKMYGIYCSFS